jgi:hypothetical protein
VLVLVITVVVVVPILILKLFAFLVCGDVVLPSVDWIVPFVV